MTPTFLNLVFGKKLRKQTRRYLADVSSAPVRAARKEADRVLGSFRNRTDAHLNIGTTSWNEAVKMPVKDLLNAHSLVTGATGAGKTRFILNIIRGLLQAVPHETAGLAVVDPKGDLFFATLLLVHQRLQELSKCDPEAARELRSRVVVIDFSSRAALASYNILARKPKADPDYFASSRADLLLDLLPSGDGLSLNARTLLTKCLLLLSEFALPITWLNNILHNEDLRQRLLSRSQQPEVVLYFKQQFAQIPKQTLAALARRIEALTSSESVKLALSGATAPDMAALQDTSRIVLVNCFGENMSRSVRQLLQALVCIDLAQGVFARKRKDVPFLWVCEEAQQCFSIPGLRDHLEDVLTMSRSFGTFLCALTQNITTAVHDAGLLHSLHTNLRWSFSLRGEPSDCAFLRPVLPISGSKLQPQTDPFKEPTYYSPNDERAIELNAVANLPDRVGWFWYRPESKEAIKITVPDVDIPSGGKVELSLQDLLGDPSFGMRVSRTEYDRCVAARNKEWLEAPPTADSNETLAEAYRRVRGKKP